MDLVSIRRVYAANNTKDPFGDDPLLLQRIFDLMKKGMLSAGDMPSPDPTQYYRISSFNYVFVTDTNEIHAFAVTANKYVPQETRRKMLDHEAVYILPQKEWRAFAVNICMAIQTNKVLGVDLQWTLFRFQMKDHPITEDYNSEVTTVLLDSVRRRLVTGGSEEGRLGSLSSFIEINKGVLYHLHNDNIMAAGLQPFVGGDFEGNNVLCIPQSRKNIWDHQDISRTYWSTYRISGARLVKRTIVYRMLSYQTTWTKDTTCKFLQSILWLSGDDDEVRGVARSLLKKIDAIPLTVDDVLREMQRKKMRNARRRAKRNKKKNTDTTENIRQLSDTQPQCEEEEGEAECMICLEPVERHDVTRCGHNAHASCVGDWGRTCQAKNLPFVCPYCRQSMETM